MKLNEVRCIVDLYVQLKRSATPELPDSTRPDDKKISTSKTFNKDESVDFDIDDIDKELEMALERKRVSIWTVHH